MSTRRGRIVSFTAGTYVATVRFDGSSAQAVAGIPVNRAIAAADMVANRVVICHAGDDGIATDMVVLAVVA